MPRAKPRFLSKVFALLIGLCLVDGRLLATGRICFSRLDSAKYWQIWVMDGDGQNVRALTTSKMDKRDPAWIDSATRIVYRTHNGRLFVIDQNGGTETEILTAFRNINNPHYSNVTDEVVFVRFNPTAVDVSEIWKANVDGSNAMLLTPDQALKYQPVFSPDGRKIVYVRADPENPQRHNLWSMSSDGTDDQQLTFSDSLDTLPAFSKDQRLLAFTSNRQDNNYEIYILDLSTREVKRLTRHPDLDTSASFSPNGETLAYVSNRSGSQQIWKIDVSGGGATQLTFDSEESVDPAWTDISQE